MALKNFMETQYRLKANPFPGQATYREDSQQIYVPEMFGPQREEFMRKFILSPLENGQPIIGAVWSIMPGDPESRGFGKSTIMGEEPKLINADFGFSTLRSLGVSDKDARGNPILAGYTSFNAQGTIGNMDAAAYHLVRFMVKGVDDQRRPIHRKLQERAAARLVLERKATNGHEPEAIVEAVRERFRKMPVAMDIRNLLEDYLYLLAREDSEDLERFLTDNVGSWHHSRNGMKYLQIFVVFAEIAGIEHFTFFIDQVEDFTSTSTTSKILKNVKILRDALFESEPFATRASFVFQLHPAAWHHMRNAWEHEDLKSLRPDDPLSAPFVVVLKGLETYASAENLAMKFLNHESVALPGRSGVAPFTSEAIRLIWERTRPKPRNFIRDLHDILNLANLEKQKEIDKLYIESKINAIVEEEPTEARTEIQGGDDRLHR